MVQNSSTARFADDISEIGKSHRVSICAVGQQKKRRARQFDRRATESRLAFSDYLWLAEKPR